MTDSRRRLVSFGDSGLAEDADPLFAGPACDPEFLRKGVATGDDGALDCIWLGFVSAAEPSAS